MKKILYAAAECGPFIKTGGLGSVLASLPGELDHENYDVRVVIPAYECIPLEWKEKMETVAAFSVTMNWRSIPTRIKSLIMEGTTYYFIENLNYFCGDYPYSDIWIDVEKFCYFCRAVLEMTAYLDFEPDIIHCHDWQSAMIPVYLHSPFYSYDPFFAGIKTVLTIHNLRYQGITDIERMKDITGLPDEMFSYDKLEHYGNANMLKGGISFADEITTVSKTYADEICTPEYGDGLEAVLDWRKDDLKGIVNGIDYKMYCPAKDPDIHTNYGPKSFPKGKKENKRALQELTGLTVGEDFLAVGIVTRLTQQKGLDLLSPVMDRILSMPVQLFVLGGGEKEYEDIFAKAAEAFPDRVYLNTSYRDDLARKIYAGTDAVLMPSRFEPCGLSQMMALRYGSVPLIRETGGLKDTVAVYTKSKTPTGFGFEACDPEELAACLETAVRVFQKDRDDWKKIVARGMRKDYSWKASCKKYEKLYDELTG
ncbi:MAG: glycogen synthase [Eubacterium sp.]|nr:glycogen synthase [Eubacterium sp.]